MLTVTKDMVLPTTECASSGGKDLSFLSQCPKSKKIAIGVANHTNTMVEPPEVIADLIRKALTYISPDQLILSTDCGFGREGLSRRIAFYKCVALTQGANIVRRELGLEEVSIRAADPQFSFFSFAEVRG